VGSTDIETMARESQGQAWFQLYFGGDEEQTFSLIERCKKAGYETLVVGVDVPEVGRRPRELRRGFKMPFIIGPLQFIDFAMHPFWALSTLFRNLPTGKPELANFDVPFKKSPSGKFDRTASRAGADWNLLKQVRDKWDGNLVVKGVLNPDDALMLKALGVDAIQVSSHGGRQLESAPPPILALPAIRKAVGPDFPLFFDSGIRGGEDIVKAYAMGADFVFLGRPFQFAIAGLGEDGLTQLTEVLSQETSITLAQLGLCDMQSIDEACLSPVNRFLNLNVPGMHSGATVPEPAASLHVNGLPAKSDPMIPGRERPGDGHAKALNL